LELPDFTRLIKQQSAAVVNISTEISPDSHGTSKNRPDIPEENPFYDFFKRFFDEAPDQYEFGERKTSSLGSGFIISADGYVITNHHVVANVDKIIVRLRDRRELFAEVIGSDKRSDIAVLKVEGKNLPHVTFGSSEALKVGEWVLAIGSPFGFDYTMTAGIVSAKGRSLPTADSNYVPFIQTDVAINPGNSGGPLFNMVGEVVGVNAQIYSRTGGFMGLSFAIPIDTAIKVVNQLRNKGKVSRGWLGVMIQDVDGDLAESFDMKRPHGALISKVLPNGPAKEAGFKVGDIIVEFDGKYINHSSALPPIVGETPVGSSVEAVVIRNGKRKIIRVRLEELPSPEAFETAARTGKTVTTHSKLGLVVEDLDDREARFGLDHGVRVIRVDKGPALEAGIRRGDFILALNRKEVKDVAHFRELVAELEPGRSVPVLIQRQNNPLFLALRIPKE
jgi:serine protease Do